MSIETKKNHTVIPSKIFMTLLINVLYLKKDELKINEIRKK